ncbi:hypothetical protein H8E88_03860 [candidate division KSB1 bacterium]|nr:hypothetical protein [candidate division KSB1 bacterium]
MVYDTDLGQLERKMYKSALFQDGLVDMLMGFLLLSNSISPFFGTIGIHLPWNILILTVPGYLLFFYARKYITTPRLGVVKFGAERKSRRKKLLIANIVAILLTVTCVILTLVFNLFPSINKYMDILLMGLISFVIPLGILAYVLDFYRIFLLGILTQIAWLALAFIDKRIPAPFDWILTFGAVGLIFMAIGLVLLIKFLRKYPARSDDISIDGENDGE